MTLTSKTLTLTKDTQRLRHIDTVWELLSEGYKDVKGGLFFTSKESLLKTTTQWKVIMLNNRIIAVTIYKAKKGLKLVAMTATKVVEYKRVAVNALRRLIRRDLKTCWMEVSEGAEKFVMKFAEAFVMNNQYVAKTLDKKITLSADGVHYFRTIKNINKEKILLGTPVFN